MPTFCYRWPWGSCAAMFDNKLLECTYVSKHARGFTGMVVVVFSER